MASSERIPTTAGFVALPYRSKNAKSMSTVEPQKGIFLGYGPVASAAP